MLFNTYTYALFFLLVLAVYWTVRGRRARLGVLLAASLVFYASWSPPFVLLLFVSIGVDYLVSHRLPGAEGTRKRLLLAASVVTNLGILATFKYADFLFENVHALLGLAGVGWEREPFGFVLPLGISFYTFQTMSYSIDVYRGKQRPIDSLLEFSVYVTFFPQLVAGPIVRASEMGPQLESVRGLDAAQGYRGLNRIALGLAKKVLLADWLAVAVVEPVFQSPESFTAASSLVAVYAYAFQIYLDFSAYCDIAIGSALLLGFRLPENFQAPYLASNVVELWRRWHVTLSTWLRDYLYIPLGGSRGGALKTYRNLLLTMVLGGLWHGASWNFVIWGAIHGVLLVAHRIWRSRSPASDSTAWRLVSIWGTFNLTCLAWIFFRAETLGQASEILAHVVALPAQAPLLVLGLSPALLLAYAGAAAVARRSLTWSPRTFGAELAYGGALGALLLVFSLLSAPRAEFIYFQF